MTNEEYYELQRDYDRYDRDGYPDSDYPPMATCNDCGQPFEFNQLSPIRCEACQAVFERHRNIK